MKKELNIKLDKASIERLEKEAAEWNVSIEEYARLILVGNKPEFLNLDENQRKDLIEAMRQINQMNQLNNMN